MSDMSWEDRDLLRRDALWEHGQEDASWGVDDDES